MSNLNLSIIIPSLGEDSLKKILNNIIHSSVLPKEVIVCLPEDKYHSYVTEYNQNKKIKFNLFFLKTKIKSQVYQRLEAFKFSKNNNILQLDDDISPYGLNSNQDVGIVYKNGPNITVSRYSYESRPIFLKSTNAQTQKLMKSQFLLYMRFILKQAGKLQMKM